MSHDAAAADLLIQLSRLVHTIHSRIAAQHGLTQVQATMVCALAFGPRGMADLAQCLGVEKATITGLVDRAERRGLVTRSPVPGDRRALSVGLTPTGRRTATAFHTDAVAGLNEILSALSPAQSEQFQLAVATILTAKPEPAHRSAETGPANQGA